MEPFKVYCHYEQQVPFSRIHLSLAPDATITAKDVTLQGSHTKGRKTIAEHLKVLMERKVVPIDSPVVVLSARNVLANLRCGAWLAGEAGEFRTVVGEDASRTQRPYHMLGMREGRLELVEILPTRESLAGYEWAISGVPVLWDDCTDMFERIVSEAADHSHVWHIPRGNHPSATPQTTAQWDALHDRFVRSLDAQRADAAATILAGALGLAREDDYLHNVVGVDDRGNLLQVCAVGRLEDLGQRLRSRGAARAIMIDNGGSVVIQFFPKGIGMPPVQVFASQSHRPAGTAYLVVELPSAAYQYVHG